VCFFDKKIIPQIISIFSISEVVWKNPKLPTLILNNQRAVGARVRCVGDRCKALFSSKIDERKDNGRHHK
jgi:hypothetical protein